MSFSYPCPNAVGETGICPGTMRPSSQQALKSKRPGVVTMVCDNCGFEVQQARHERHNNRGMHPGNVDNDIARKNW